MRRKDSNQERSRRSILSKFIGVLLPILAIGMAATVLVVSITVSGIIIGHPDKSFMSKTL